MQPAPDRNKSTTHTARPGAARLANRYCTAMRHIMRSHMRMNLATGVMTKTAIEETVEPCGAPLFTEAERADGTCRHCAAGWEAEGNRFATPDEIAAYTRNLAPHSAL